MKSTLQKISHLRELDKFPPYLCRLVARTNYGRGAGRQPLSTAEIARRSGLSRVSVYRISRRKSWRTMSIDKIIRFSEACGVNILDPRPHIEYLRKCKKVALKKFLVNSRVASPLAQ